MSPSASGAGADCCEATYQRKHKYYSAQLAALTPQDIRYVLLVFSCYGRLRPEAASTLENVARTATRKRGFWTIASLCEGQEVVWSCGCAALALGGSRDQELHPSMHRG